MEKQTELKDKTEEQTEKKPEGPPMMTVAAHEEVAKAYTSLVAEHEALKEKHAALDAEHQNLKIQFGLAKKEYEWREGDTKCQPVGMDEKCTVCGWTADTKEPHPVRI